jgi:outer membrane murein-binding lipoprotein Lpp
MTKKILIGIMMIMSLLLTSCYPELSVQQYDQLKEDLKNLDVKRIELEAEIAALEQQITAIQQENAETRRYLRDNIAFLEKIVATQSKTRVLTGEFDIESLVDAKGELLALSGNITGSNISYYLEMMKSDNQTQTVAAYYAVLENCFKQMRDATK